MLKIHHGNFSNSHGKFQTKILICQDNIMNFGNPSKIIKLNYFSLSAKVINL